MKFVAVEPKMKPYVIEAEKEDVNLEWLQHYVDDGYIEIVPSLKNPELDLIINDEGKLIPLVPNRRYGNDILFGRILVVAYDEEGEIRGLSEKEIKKAKEEFSEVEHLPYDLNPFDYVKTEIIML